MTTKTGRPRGRPRGFDADAALATGKQLFHAQGYDAVGIAAVTGALGINPPSFYAAFGSKAGFFAQVLAKYSREAGVPLDELLSEELPVAAALTAVLLDAARRYTADPQARGCMVLEGLGCDDPDARCAAAAHHQAAVEMIRRFVAERHPGQAGRVTDLVATTMAGFSAMARQGVSEERLVAVAELVGQAVAQALASPATTAAKAGTKDRAGKSGKRASR